MERRSGPSLDRVIRLAHNSKYIKLLIGKVSNAPLCFSHSACSFLRGCSGCATSDSAIRDQGHGEAYLQGFHDGRHSGMKEAGNTWEHYVRDHERFSSDPEYQQGWIAGGIEGKHIQEQAKAIGSSISGAHTGYRVGQEVDKNTPDADKAANDALKGVDTSVFKNLEN